MGDRVTVQSSKISLYAVRAVLHMKGDGPGGAVALDAAKNACDRYVNRARRQGVSVWRSAITAAAHVEGVERLELLEPAQDIVLDRTQAGTCTAIDLRIAGESADD
ncbi:Baseplate J-like protein [compost metagenome]